MVSITAATLALLLANSHGPGSVSAQQFNGRYRPVSFPGITHSCFSALNSTLDCSFFFWEASYREPALTAQNHSDLICTTSCLESLFATQKAAAKACISDADVIWDSHLTVATPAKWIIDRLLYNFNESCVVEHVTGKLCASVLQSLPPSNARGSECAQCALDMMDMKLKSPLRYSEDEARKFNSTISSCSAIGYTVTSPSPTTTNATRPDQGWMDAFLAAPTPTFNENCTRRSKVRPHDTYNSLAAAKNVSSLWLRANDYNTDADLNEALRVGTSYCLPPGECHAYTVQENETCEDIIRKATNPMNSTQLEIWNPKISEICNDSARLNGTVVCLSSPPECTWCPWHRTTTTTTTTSTFSGCRDKWDSYWPGKPYNSCWCPFPPSSCYTRPTTSRSNLYSWFKSCKSGRRKPLTEGFCATNGPSWVMARTTSVEALQTDRARASDQVPLQESSN